MMTDLCFKIFFLFCILTREMDFCLELLVRNLLILILLCQIYSLLSCYVHLQIIVSIYLTYNTRDVNDNASFFDTATYGCAITWLFFVVNMFVFLVLNLLMLQ